MKTYDVDRLIEVVELMNEFRPTRRFAEASCRKIIAYGLCRAAGFVLAIPLLLVLLVTSVIAYPLILINSFLFRMIYFLSGQESKERDAHIWMI